jgi:hypothetical protein
VNEGAAFPWEERSPLFDTSGFRCVTGTLEVSAGYADFGGPVLLYVIEDISGTKRVWRRVWTTREAAADQAESLVADIEDYIETIPATPRPVEDLSLDDFIQHITERYTHGLH